jgi:hypothetical protein
VSTEARGKDATFDVYIAYTHADSAWAERLAADLSRRGLTCFSDLHLSPGQPWSEALGSALQSSSVLVVLWGPTAPESKSLLAEIASFDTLMRQKGMERRLIPLVLGSSASLADAPNALASHQAIFVGQRTYELGPNNESPDWVEAIEAIAGIAYQFAGFTAQESSPPFGSQIPSESSQVVGRLAETALTCAAEMLEGADVADDDLGRIRSAALLAALWASASGRRAPSTGDIVELIEERHRVPVSRVLHAAATQVGLSLPVEPARKVSDHTVLSGSRASWIVQGAVGIQLRTGGKGVQLRHVLAVGVHRSVPRQVFVELGVSIDELKRVWRDSIARTWPKESLAAWDEVLEIGAVAPDTSRPPSARVHADRWTTDDRLDYALYAKAISEFIRHPDATTPMVISVQAPWGQGKTSFMRMIQENLDPNHPDLRHKDETPGHLIEPPSAITFGELRSSLDGSIEISDPETAAMPSVWFNAWKYQSSEQIWAGLAHAILDQLPARLSRKDRERFWLRLQLRRIDPTAVRKDIYRATLEIFLPRLAGIVGALLAVLIAIGLSLLAGGREIAGIAAGGSFLGTIGLVYAAWSTSLRKVLERRLEGAYLRYVRQPDYTSRLGYLHLVEEDMSRALDLLTPPNEPAVIFIDDLDRCSPAKIGEVIEAVNLFLAGDYPNCVFVMGIDAEVVAASMEVVHASIIEKLTDRRGELGWRFLDKFVQLPFVMPRLNPKQRETYLHGLFSSIEPLKGDELLVEADRLERDIDSRSLSIDELADRAGGLAPRLATVSPARARSLGEQVVEAGAQAFSDRDPEVGSALTAQMRYLSGNPRTIKRAVNLYRFHRFAAFARQASPVPLEVATPEQIARWVVVIVRWPQFVRWLQAQREEAEGGQVHPAAQLIALAARAGSPDELKALLHENAIHAPWTDDIDLLEFLKDEIRPELRLDLASGRGLW